MHLELLFLTVYEQCSQQVALKSLTYNLLLVLYDRRCSFLQIWSPGIILVSIFVCTSIMVY